MKRARVHRAHWPGGGAWPLAGATGGCHDGRSHKRPRRRVRVRFDGWHCDRHLRTGRQ